MISYFLAANCYGLLFYGCYLLLLKGRSSHTWNRVYLLAVVLLVLSLPLVKFDLPVLYAPKVTQTLSAVTLPEITMYPSGDSQQPPWFSSFPLWQLLYAGIAAIFLIRFLYKSISLRLFLGKQQYVQQDGYRLALNTGVGPASFGTTILFPGPEMDYNILNHEKAHLQYGHHYDKLLMELLLCFFYPVLPLFFIRKELALVHEFEADAAADTDDESYARTLLSEHLGTREYHLLQSFFHHPLKRRIMMLRRNQEGKNNRNAKTLVLFCTALLSGSIVYAQSVKQERPQPKTAAQQALVVRPAKSSTGNIPDQAPEFPGGEKALMTYIRNGRLNVDPGSYRENYIPGNMLVSFVVNEKGRIDDITFTPHFENPASEEEAQWLEKDNRIRKLMITDLLKTMPAWKPGMKDGKAIPVGYQLAFLFAKPETPDNYHVQQQPEDHPAQQQEEQVFISVEHMPRPSVDIMKYLAENIRYPEEAKKNGIQGRVILKFVVDTEGNVNNVVLQRDIGGGCGEEAMRVARNMPKWTPGMQGGKPVSVYYTLPVSFRMQDTDKDNGQPTAPNR